MSNHITAPPTTPSAGPLPSPGRISSTTAPTIDHLEYWKAGLRELKTFRGHSHGVWTVAYAPDGQTLASGGVDRYVRLWDIETGRLLRSLRGHTADIRALVFMPDGRALASGVKIGPSASGIRKPGNRRNSCSHVMTTMSAASPSPQTASC